MFGKNPLKVFLIAVYCMFHLLYFTPSIQGMEVNDCFSILDNSCDSKALIAAAAFESVTDSFEQMFSLTAPQGFINGYYYIEPANMEELMIRMIKAGFTTALSARIIAAYLFWDPELQRIVLIPTDSIPMIFPQDREQIAYCMLTDDVIVFRRLFFNCYQLEDQYILYVTAIKTENGWVICEWQFQPAASVLVK